ncbi:uncharacterized protein P884DRAFT_260076 [Thermothelomyces heterothallicus CBS 202.75]|uniref:uncharacterized protein n=1 Tax=Thermothelomyces heterothallicus CBS 202.75 TaxID=1149848 RepID=UPI0037423AE9
MSCFVSHKLCSVLQWFWECTPFFFLLFFLRSVPSAGPPFRRANGEATPREASMSSSPQSTLRCAQLVISPAAHAATSGPADGILVPGPIVSSFFFFCSFFFSSRFAVSCCCVLSLRCWCHRLVEVNESRRLSNILLVSSSAEPERVLMS